MERMLALACACLMVLVLPVAAGEGTSRRRPMKVKDLFRFKRIGDPQAPKNLEVAELAANERAYKSDPLVLEAQPPAQGLR